MPACRVMCAGECIGHAGVQMGKWSVHEVRVVQSASTVTFAGRSQQRRERVDGADARLTSHVRKFSMFARSPKESKNGSRLGAAPPTGYPCVAL